MIIKFSDYDSKYRICILAKTESVRDYLAEKNLNVVMFQNDSIHFYPDDISFQLNEKAKEQLAGSDNFDVFEIDCLGNAYKYYNNQSVDNAILITNQCNSNCVMCPTAESIRQRETNYSADNLIEIIRHFPQDAPHITITGGEPFLLKKDIFKVFNYLKTNFDYSEYLLLTNGRAFCSKEYANLFAENAPTNIILGIPVHGHNSEIHDSITQAKDSFNQTIAGIKNLIARGADIELRIVVSKMNADDLTLISDLIISELKGIMCVKIIGLEMTGNAARNRDVVWIDYPTAFEKSKECIDNLIKAGIDVGIYNFPLCAVDKKYWNICEKSISDYKIRYTDDCNNCKVKDACGGIFSGTIRLANASVKPVR